MKRILITLLIITGLIIPVFSISAQGEWNLNDRSVGITIGEGQGAGIEGSQKSTSSGVLGVIDNVAYFIIRIVGSLSVLTLIAGGTILIIQSNNEEGISRGKEMIKYSIIGLIFVFMSYLIVKLLQILLYAQ